MVSQIFALFMVSNLPPRKNVKKVVFTFESDHCKISKCVIMIKRSLLPTCVVTQRRGRLFLGVICIF